MKNQKYFNMLREIKDIAFATVDNDGKPDIRIIDVMFIEAEKLFFVTARGKDFYGQLMTQGEVAVTGLNERWQSIRLKGKVKKEKQSLLKTVFEKNPSMNAIYPGKSKLILEVFSLYAGEGELFDLGEEPIQRESFSFGGAEITPKGFRIEDRCIECGKCYRNCPQQCIEIGSPYYIRQKNCLHCGLCMEVCPVKAIDKP